MFVFLHLEYVTWDFFLGQHFPNMGGMARDWQSGVWSTVIIPQTLGSERGPTNLLLSLEVRNIVLYVPTKRAEGIGRSERSN